MLQLRRGDAEAGEDDRRGDFARGAQKIRARNDVFANGQRRTADSERRLILQKLRDAKGDRLLRCLQSDGGELRGDIPRADVVATRSWLAAFEQVTREKSDVRRDGVRQNDSGKHERECI